MHVKLTTNISGTRDGERWPPAGSEIEVSDDEGATLCANGLAEPVAAPEKKKETAVRSAPQKRKAAKE